MPPNETFAEEGIGNELDYVEQISWVLFLKYLHDLESDRRDQAALEGKSYATHGESELSLSKLATFLIARYGTLADAKSRLGELTAIKAAFVDLQRDLYAS